MKVSVIVVCYNEENNIKNCLTSILENNYPKGNYEVVVVDNDSMDNTQNIVKEFVSEHNNIRLTLNKERGIAVSRNIGLKEAAYPYVAFTDADCEVPNDWLEVLSSGFMKYKKIYPELAGVGGTNFAPRDTDVFYDSVNITLKTLLGNRDSTQGKQYVKDMLVPHIPTLNVLYDKEMIETIGAFDGNFRFVCEDPELNHRVIESGYKIMMLKNSYVLHRFTKGYKPWFGTIFKYGMGRIQIIKKHPSHFNSIYLIPPLIPLLWLTSIISIFRNWPIGYVLISYCIFVFAYSLFHCLTKNKLSLLLRVYSIYLLTHLAYGLGEICGLLIETRKIKQNVPEP